MKRSKKTLCALMAAFLLMTLVSCGKSNTAAQAEMTGSVTPSPTAVPSSTAASPTATAAVKTTPEPTEDPDPAVCTHAHIQYDVVSVAGCTTVGKAHYVCSDCGTELSTVVLEARGHAYAWQGDSNTHWQQCSVCGDKKAAASHTFNASHVCTVCGYGCTHDLADTVTAPGCTTSGYTTHTCRSCGYSYVDTFVIATGHRYESTVLTAAKCTEDGTMKLTCSACGSSFTLPVYALGHDPVTDEAVAATCQHTGLTEGSHCSRCQTVLTEQQVAPVTDHVYLEGRCIYCLRSAPEGSKYAFELPEDTF